MKTVLTALLALVVSANTAFAYCGGDEQADNVARLAKAVHETSYQEFVEEPTGKNRWNEFLNEFRDLRECVESGEQGYSKQSLNRALFWAKLANQKVKAVTQVHHQLNP